MLFGDGTVDEWRFAAQALSHRKRKSAVKSAALAHRRRSRAGTLRLLVRALPALVGRLPWRRRGAARHRRAGLRHRLPAARAPDRRDAPQGPQQHRARPQGRSRAARGRSAARRAATTRSIPISAATPTSTRWWRPRATRASSWRSTSRSRPRPTTRGSASTRSGSTADPTARSSTPRTRRSATRTSTTSTGTRTSARRSGTRCKDVVLGWCARGILVFRVDNPHTKPMPFWEWLIAEVRAVHPEAIFLAEAFTRPAPMTTLAKIGFSQSYTYFAWKNTKAELVEFVEQARSWSAFYRPNMWPNTPDILHEYLQHGGRPAFEARLVLAATLSPSYGIYSGYEACENVPVREGSEEYLDSEKYEVKKRDARGAAAAADPARERDPAGASGAAAVREPDLARDPQRRPDCVREAGRRGCRDHGRQPRSGGRLRKGCASSRRSSGCRTPSRPSTCSPTRATAGAPAGTTSGSRPAART